MGHSSYTLTLKEPSEPEPPLARSPRPFSPRSVSVLFDLMLSYIDLSYI